jgi:enoyl-CoA hydratase
VAVLAPIARHVQARFAIRAIAGTFFDGVARHTREGRAFLQRMTEVGFRQAVRERDEPFGDAGPSTFKG